MEKVDGELPGPQILAQKNMKLPRNIFFQLDELKKTNYKLGHAYVTTQILNAVLPRILEKIKDEAIISLDGLHVRL